MHYYKNIVVHLRIDICFCPVAWLFIYSIISQVKVLFAGQDIDKSPFMVNVAKALGDPSKVQARGPGLEAVGNMAHKPTHFDIYTAGEQNAQNVVWTMFFYMKLHSLQVLSHSFQVLGLEMLVWSLLTLRIKTTLSKLF